MLRRIDDELCRKPQHCFSFHNFKYEPNKLYLGYSLKSYPFVQNLFVTSETTHITNYLNGDILFYTNDSIFQNFVQLISILHNQRCEEQSLHPVRHYENGKMYSALCRDSEYIHKTTSHKKSYCTLILSFHLTENYTTNRSTLQFVCEKVSIHS